MTTIRILTENGINNFREYIHSIRGGNNIPLPELNSTPYSVPFHKLIDIDEKRTFTTRLEIAEYLYDIFNRAGLKRFDLIGYNGLWTWLAYLWFDTLCPHTDRGRKIKDISTYINSSDYTDYYRHSVAIVYDIYSIHGKNNSRLFLECPPHILNDFVENLASRQWIISNTRLIDVTHKLYWDDKNQRPKIGSTNRNKSGTLRRFINVISQFELTYDIHNLDPDKIIGILPDEFKLWIDS